MQESSRSVERVARRGSRWMAPALAALAVGFAVGSGPWGPVVGRRAPAYAADQVPGLAVADPTTGRMCPPLPPPQGPIVDVQTETELQAAVRGLRSGETILIHPGVYRLASTLQLTGGLRDVSVRGPPGRRDQVVLQGRGMTNPGFGSVPHGFLIGDASGVLIADLTVKDVYYHPVQIQGESGARDILLYGLHLVDAGEQFVKGSTAGPPGPYADGGEVACCIFEYTDRARSDYTNAVDVLAGADWIVRDNVFRRIRAPRGELAGPAVLFWRNSVNTLVERNLFVECDRGIAMGLSKPDPTLARDGEATFDHQESVVRNNMIYQPAGADTTDIGISVNYARDFKVLHNTVILNGTFPWGAIEYRFPVSTGEIKANLTDAPIWRRDGATALVEANVTDALLAWFRDSESGDLHLRSSAAGAIDIVASSPDTPDDYDGELRPLGPAADVGADEYQAASVSPTATRHATTTTAPPTATEPHTSRYLVFLPVCAADRAVVRRR